MKSSDLGKKHGTELVQKYGQTGKDVFDMIVDMGELWMVVYAEQGQEKAAQMLCDFTRMLSEATNTAIINAKARAKGEL